MKYNLLRFPCQWEEMELHRQWGPTGLSPGSWKYCWATNSAPPTSAYKRKHLPRVNSLILGLWRGWESGKCPFEDTRRKPGLFQGPKGQVKTTLNLLIRRHWLSADSYSIRIQSSLQGIIKHLLTSEEKYRARGWHTGGYSQEPGRGLSAASSHLLKGTEAEQITSLCPQAEVMNYSWAAWVAAGNQRTKTGGRGGATSILPPPYCGGTNGDAWVPDRREGWEKEGHKWDYSSLYVSSLHP